MFVYYLFGLFYYIMFVMKNIFYGICYQILIDFFCPDDEQENYKIQQEIEDKYFQITIYPIIEEIVNNKFGNDISYIIFDYFKSIKIPILEILLNNKFGDEIAAIVMDYLSPIIKQVNNKLNSMYKYSIPFT
eukprot:448499_1